jgi:hypothetical protein
VTVSVLDEVEKSIIQTGAFCVYIMMVEKCSQEDAVKRMAQLCTVMQVHLGKGDSAVNQK